MEYKEFLIVSDGTFGYKKIKPMGKGSVKALLRGDYTDANHAKVAIDQFLSTKGKANVKKTKGPRIQDI